MTRGGQKNAVALYSGPLSERCALRHTFLGDMLSPTTAASEHSSYGKGTG